MINAAIVGAGDWGQKLVRSVQGKSEHIRFTAAVARTPEKVADFAREAGLCVYSAYQQALADAAIDAVVLATPHSQHAEQVIAAARAGKPVFVEKPFTLTQASAVAAVEACRRADVLLAVGQNRRFLPALQKLKALVDDGQIGTVLQVEGNFSAGGGYRFGGGTWRADRSEAPAGGMTALGIHMLDAMLSVCGEVDQVHAYSTRRVVAIDVDDATAILMRLRSGAPAYLGTCFATAPYTRLHVFGSEGWVEMRGWQTLTHTPRQGQAQELAFAPCDIERAELEAFAAAIEGTGTYPVTTAQAVHAVAVLEAITRSSATGEVVQVT